MQEVFYPTHSVIFDENSYKYDQHNFIYLVIEGSSEYIYIF